MQDRYTHVTLIVSLGLLTVSGRCEVKTGANV